MSFSAREHPELTKQGARQRRNALKNPCFRRIGRRSTRAAPRAGASFLTAGAIAR
jgi:hypothetical protein